MTVEKKNFNNTKYYLGFMFYCSFRKCQTVKMLETLSNPLFKVALRKNNHFILLQSKGHKSDNLEIDVPFFTSTITSY